MTSGALAGTVVVDVSRMLPGAVLARELLDLGARVVKVEAPVGGDPMREIPPVVDGVGAAFRAYYAGAESVCLDLRDAAGAAALRRLARHADVLVESFRPGTLDAWGAGPQRLARLNPSLVVCSLSSYGQASERVGHDLNFVAESGLLELLGTESVPRAQLADVAAGLQACSAVLAALLSRSRTGRGAVLDVPLAAAPGPFVAFAAAERHAGGGGAVDRLLAGECPAYGVYTCGDGRRVAVGALEPKFWADFAEAAGLSDLAGAGLEPDASARRRVADRLAEAPASHWLEIAEERNLPITLVRRVEETPPATAAAAAPRLGEHTREVLARIGFSVDETDALGCE
jgi:alpha-methylacyl-CoA racemase